MITRIIDLDIYGKFYKVVVEFYVETNGLLEEISIVGYVKKDDYGVTKRMVPIDDKTAVAFAKFSNAKTITEAMELCFSEMDSVAKSL